MLNAQEWRQILRNYREEFQDCRKALQETCRKSLSKDQLLEVEHFDNQFHIQLINIHDLKQSMKIHERKIQFETARGAEASEATYAHHEELLDQFLSWKILYRNLEKTLKILLTQQLVDFITLNFLHTINCVQYLYCLT